jgi:hypothetical protein
MASTNETLTPELIEELVALHHPSERAAYRKIYEAQRKAQQQKPNEAKVVRSRDFISGYAVQYPDGSIENCHNLSTAQHLVRTYNN